MKKHNELSQVVITVAPKDLNGDAYTPTSARYKVNDRATSDEMVQWTTLTPSTSMTITVPPSVNTIISDSNENEVKTVTVNLDEGLDTQHYLEYDYKVVNLKFVS